MKKNKSVLYLCEGILCLMMTTLFFCLYLSKPLREFTEHSKDTHHPFLIVLGLISLCIVLALIQHELLSRLVKNAFSDVTGIHNKKSLEKKIQELNNRNSTFDIGVMMFDLNGLKHVNDTFGHEKGDEFIQSFAYCLTRILDEHCFLARYGGDEFVIIKEHTAPDDLKQMDTRLNHLVQEYNTRSSLPLSYAVGYEVSYRNHYFMINDLIQAADKNMYQDKFYKKTDAIKGELPAFSRPSSVIPTVSSDILAEKIRQFQSNAKNIHPIALVSMDIENFHYINDKYGYPLGNEILNILYEELASSSFSLFTIRFFSDVFITIADMKEATPKELSEQVQALDHKICSRIRDTYQVSFFRTNSGICLMQDEAQTPEAVISCTNIARRMAKKMISHTCIYSDEIDHQEKMQAEILHSFHQALNDQEFQIYFQPKVQSVTGQITSAEALVRWIRGGKLLWTPDVYIPLFEQNGFIIDLDYYIYEKTFSWIQNLSVPLPEGFRFSLNVSPLHFEQPQVFIQKVWELINAYHIPPSLLTFEITESAYVNNQEAVNQVIRSFKQHQIYISMDDFGSGYSSLNTLKNLLFDEVKIDRKFLGDSLTENARIVLQEIFHMLKRMNKLIVCEGVETPEIADFLKEEGCSEIQGFLYYRPMCCEEFEKLMHEKFAA